jgi:uncharacterized MAPEG superfamily protein
MPVEVTILGWGCVLAFIHIFAAAHVKTKQYGLEWNMGARDEALPPLAPVVGRLARAQANFFETFPIAAIAILMVTAGGLSSRWTVIGALLWLVGRIVYLPLYAAGVPKVRTLVWGGSLIGIVMLLWPVLKLSWA